MCRLAIGIFIALSAVYIVCLAPNWGAMTQFNTWDGLEYVICANLLGIDHPPGHPLYLILGKIFTLLPFGDPSWNINLISAVFGAAAAVVLFSTLLLILRRIHEGPEGAVVALAISATLAFSYVFWSHCEIPEVHTLFLFLVGLCVYSVVRWYVGGGEAWLSLAAAALAAGIGVNLLGVLALLLPVVILMLAARRVERLKFKWRLPLAIFFSGFIPYVYYPIRIAHWPVYSHPMNYLCPNEPGSFAWYVWYISGKSWTGGQMFFISRILHNIPLYLRFAVRDLGLPAFLFAVIGIAFGFREVAAAWREFRAGGSSRSGRILLPFLFVLFLFSLVPEISIHDPSNPRAYEYLQNFFLPSLYLLALLAGAGAMAVYAYARRSSRAAAWAILAVLAAVPVYQCAANYRYCDLKGEECAYVYSKRVLEQLPAGAIVASKLVYGMADAYFSLVEHLIPPGKITIYDPELVTRRVAKESGKRATFSVRHKEMLADMDKYMREGKTVFLAGDIVDEDKSPEKLLLADLNLVRWEPVLSQDERRFSFPRELFLLRVEGMRRGEVIEAAPSDLGTGAATGGRFANGVALRGFRFEAPDRTIRQDVINLRLYWTATAPIQDDVYSAVIFLDGRMRRVGEPCWHTIGGGFGAREWKRSGVVSESVNLFPPPLAPGRYHLAIAMSDDRGNEIAFIPSDASLAGRSFGSVLLTTIDVGIAAPPGDSPRPARR